MHASWILQHQRGQINRCALSNRGSQMPFCNLHDHAAWGRAPVCFSPRVVATCKTFTPFLLWDATCRTPTVFQCTRLTCCRRLQGVQHVPCQNVHCHAGTWSRLTTCCLPVQKDVTKASHCALQLPSILERCPIGWLANCPRLRALFYTMQTMHNPAPKRRSLAVMHCLEQLQVDYREGDSAALSR